MPPAGMAARPSPPSGDEGTDGCTSESAQDDLAAPLSQKGAKRGCHPAVPLPHLAPHFISAAILLTLCVPFCRPAGQPWTQQEHCAFLNGLKALGRKYIQLISRPEALPAAPGS